MTNETQNDDTTETVERKPRPTVIGKVVSDSMQKTIVVSRDTKKLHPLYKKYIRRSTRFVAHDEDDVARAGDEVEIAHTRPISKTKRWRLVEILTEREVASVAPEAIDQSLVEEVQRSAAHAEADETAEVTATGDEATDAAENSSDEEEGN